MTTSGADASGTLRDLVRLEVVARQLSRHLPAPPGRVLDVGGETSAQALRLACVGFDVVLLRANEESHAAAVRACDREPESVRCKVDVRAGWLSEVAEAVDDPRFDVVLCHGALAHTATARETVVAVSDLVAPGGVVSFVALNAEGVALRPALEGRWADALDLLLAGEEPQPLVVGKTGSSLRAQRLEELAAYVAGRRMHVEGWYGVGLLTAGVAGGQSPPVDADERSVVLAAEELAGRTDPYRRVAPMLHVVGRRMAA
jgi:2-polyprenyl-3-methyl-5-hydroxy-6-metoxy-1,4-benzoquinol methylase